jgi:hypothetical protein
LQIPQGIECWMEFFNALFRRHVQKYLEMEGVMTVIVGFDDSSESPAAKGPTQAKRRSKCTVPEWNLLCPLPPTVPAEYASLLLRSGFKTRVIRYVIEQVTTQCKIVRPGQKIVIDYKGMPYVAVGEGAAEPAVEGSAPISAQEYRIDKKLGECDVKWTRYSNWAGLYGYILCAVDSDYTIIGISTVERLGNMSPQIFVRRLVVDPSNAAIVASGGEGKKKAVSKKRTLEEKENLDPDGRAPVKRSPRVYEYVDCNLLVDIIRKRFCPMTPNALRPYTVQMLTFCVALCGCDFTHGVSWLNGTSFWKNADILWPGICAAASVDLETGVVSMNPRVIADKVIGKLWKNVQFKKYGISSTNFEQIHAQLMENGNISAFRRERLITPEKLCCLVKACNWTTFYWSNCEKCPCAVKSSTDYGFIMGKAGRVEFDDKKALPAS